MKTAGLCLLAMLVSGCAAIATHQRDAADGRENSGIERRLWETHAFLRHHPDIRFRKLGFWHAERTEYPLAVRAFEEAARYADKPSQAVLAEWYFDGRHLPADRVRAYAWMDLAAERGYPLYLAKRERPRSFWVAACMPTMVTSPQRPAWPRCSARDGDR
jgi:TPR repeat protein